MAIIIIIIIIIIIKWSRSTVATIRPDGAFRIPSLFSGLKRLLPIISSEIHQLLFLWRPLSYGGPWATTQFAPPP